MLRSTDSEMGSSDNGPVGLDIIDIRNPNINDANQNVATVCIAIVAKEAIDD
jgi:hypothetical protein